MTAYNAAGTPVNLQLRWVKTDSASLGGPHQDTWNLFYQTDSTATGTQVAWVNVGTNFTFSANGALTSPVGLGDNDPRRDRRAVNRLATLTFNLGSGGLTQYRQHQRCRDHQQHHRRTVMPPASLQSVAINNNGLVVGTFSNGQNIDLASVTLSHFNGTNYLQGARWRRLCRDRAVGAGDRRRFRARSAVRRSKDRTPTSPTNSPS